MVRMEIALFLVLGIVACYFSFNRRNIRKVWICRLSGVYEGA